LRRFPSSWQYVQVCPKPNHRRRHGELKIRVFREKVTGAGRDGREGGKFLPPIFASAGPIDDTGDVEFVNNKDVVVMEIGVNGLRLNVDRTESRLKQDPAKKPSIF
jgi:hypothetical protein